MHPRPEPINASLPGLQHRQLGWQAAVFRGHQPGSEAYWRTRPEMTAIRDVDEFPFSACAETWARTVVLSMLSVTAVTNDLNNVTATVSSPTSGHRRNRRWVMF